MDRKTAEKLCAINTRFYAVNADSFSQTRNAPWNGWHQCMEACGFVDGANRDLNHRTARRLCAESSLVEGPRASVLDIACGNLRFETFLSRAHPSIDWQFFAVDNCEPLVGSGDVGLEEKVHFICEDVVGNLIEGSSVISSENDAEIANDVALTQASPFDLVVSFGFMHHIPGFDLRLRFLEEALDLVRPGGHLAVSFWQFLNDEAKRAKIQQTNAEALEYYSGELAEELFLLQAEISGEADSSSSSSEDRKTSERSGCEDDESSQRGNGRLALQNYFEHLVLRPDDLETGDYLLGWKNRPGQYRYCHHFSDEEIGSLIATLEPSARVVTSFSADGKTGNLNRYVVFRRCV